MITRLARTSAAAVVAGMLLTASPAGARPDQPSTPPSTTAADSVGAPVAWAAGHTGDGVGIALVDTGVSPRPELGDAVAGQVEVGAPGRKTDGHGHGTFLAGLIGADGGTACPPGSPRTPTSCRSRSPMPMARRTSTR